jgi:hypothetical protein
MEKNNVFNKCCWENWISMFRNEVEALATYTNTNSKWTKPLMQDMKP